MKLAVDAMGGDLAPAEVIYGVCQALEFLQDDTIVLVGRKPDIMEHLSGHNGWQEKIEILHADEVIGMGDSPTNSIRQKKDSSMNRPYSAAWTTRWLSCVTRPLARLFH